MLQLDEDAAVASLLKVVVIVLGNLLESCVVEL
jgi:hypothetical protein